IGPLFPGAPDSSVESDTLNFTELETFGLRTEITKILGESQVLTYGLEAWGDDSRNTDFSETTTTLRFPFPPFERAVTTTDGVANAPNAENSSWGIFVQDEILRGKRFKAILGARYQEIETQAKPTTGWDITGLDFDDSSLVGSINLLYALTDHLHLVGSWGTAFRAPNIIERLFNGLTPEGIGFQVLNPDLESEESENIDLGLKYQSRRGFVELFYFENDIDGGIIQYFLTPEEIAELPAATRQEIAATGVEFVVQQRNLDRLTYEGVELSGAYRFDAGISIGGNFSWLEGRRLDSANLPTGDSYGEKANFYFRYAPFDSPWSFEYRARHNSEQDLALTAGEPPPVVGSTLPAFTVHGLYGGYAFTAFGADHKLGLLVDNLTDELYAEFSNVAFFRPQPERNFILTYSLDL
ncbi:MAG: TonB-dependent receptor, partial [Holophagales bacterium]|nr:TonB-dependent receptor [Holophagales bacterium]